MARTGNSFARNIIKEKYVLSLQAEKIFNELPTGRNGSAH